MTNASFISRKREGDSDKDYITIANDKIRSGKKLDPNGKIYREALKQYNSNVTNGSLKRLDVPAGFCGYIDPASGKLRVEPLRGETDVKTGQTFTSGSVSVSVGESVSVSYPVDECLQDGLPGSYEYATSNLGEEDGDNSCSGLNWYPDTGEEDDSVVVVELTEEEQEALESLESTETICGAGSGVNSNLGLASSDPIGGLGTDDIPSAVWDASNSYALGLYPNTCTEEDETLGIACDTGAGYVYYTISSESSVSITYNLYYNIYEPSGSVGAEYYKGQGLIVTVVYDIENDAAYVTQHELNFDN